MPHSTEADRPPRPLSIRSERPWRSWRFRGLPRIEGDTGAPHTLAVDAILSLVLDGRPLRVGAHPEDVLELAFAELQVENR